MSEYTPPRRKLATILAADVAGFSRHMERDEEGTLSVLKGHKAIIEQLVGRHEGRIFGTAGDSVIAEFASAVESVRCAIAIQEELAGRNGQLAEREQLWFRMGINVGDVMVEGDDLFGDGVNVAARLESLAQPGGICIAGSVFELVKGKLSYTFEDMGPQSVKNIADPVPAFRLMRDTPSVSTGHATPAPIKKKTPGKGRRRLLWATVIVTVAFLGIVIGAALTQKAVKDKINKAAARQSSVAKQPATARPSVADQLAGKTVEGVTRRTGKPFKLHLGKDGTAVVTVQTGNDPAKTRRETGQWRVNDRGELCLQFRKLASGRAVCRPIPKDPAEVGAFLEAPR